MYVGFTGLSATEFQHHWKNFSGTTIMKFVTEKTPNEVFTLEF